MFNEYRITFPERWTGGVPNAQVAPEKRAQLFYVRASIITEAMAIAYKLWPGQKIEAGLHRENVPELKFN